MSHEAITALNAAIDKLEAELSGDPRFALLKSLREARDAFGTTTDPAGSPSQPPLITKLKKSTVEEPKLSPGRARAYQICKQALVGYTEPVRTRDLYSLVVENGVHLPGGANNLSSLLSRHPTVFEGHGRSGWTLIDTGNGAEPNSGANGGGPAPLFSSSQEGGEGNEATTTH